MTNIIKKITNYAIAVTKHAADGFKHVSQDVYEARVSICESCPLNMNGECGLCGCPIETKALWASEACPDKKWLADSSEQKKSGFSANTTEKPVKKSTGCSKCKNRH